MKLPMKTALLAACFGLLTSAGAVAQSQDSPTSANKSDKKILAVVTSNRPDAEAIARANRLTDKMAQQLHLNNYQTSKLRALNREKAKRMFEIERAHAANPKKVEDDCHGLCQEQERDLRSLFSTSQYSDYYEARADFYSYDKQFIAQMQGSNRRPTADEQVAVPGQTNNVELKTSTAEPTLRQGKQ